MILGSQCSLRRRLFRIVTPVRLMNSCWQLLSGVEKAIKHYTERI
jgi:hypothetical protein